MRIDVAWRISVQGVRKYPQKTSEVYEIAFS